MATPSQPDPTTHLANYSTSEPIESSTLTLMTISSAESLPSHSRPLAESCLLVMTITIVMSGIHSRARGSGSCQGTTTGLVVWELAVMVLLSVLEVGTVYSRSVIVAREIGNADDRSGHRPYDARSLNEPFSTAAYNAFLEFSDHHSTVYPLFRLFLSCLLT
jgi:hypothetical protein